MNISEIYSKSILRKQKKVDSWFISKYGMNLYRGCQHNCIYCDGRDSKYQVGGDFGTDISVKLNSAELLEKELVSLKKRESYTPGFILLGGGVNDSYQPLENKYKLSHDALNLLEKYELPVHILTKSVLVERDLEIIKRINKKTQVIISFSFSSVDTNMSRIFEPGVPPPFERLRLISRLKDAGISCGMFLMPVIPFLTDTPEKMYASLKAAKDSGVDFVIFGGMTLKPGRQKEYFSEQISKHYPEVLINYDIIYKDNKWGQAESEYISYVNEVFYLAAASLKIPIRITPDIYNRFVTDNERVIIQLEHLDYLLKLRQNDSPYGYAAYEISKLKTPLEDIRHDLRSIKGVGPVTAKIIREILDKGSSPYLEKLLYYR